MRKAGVGETGWSCCSEWRRDVCGRIFKDQRRTAPSLSCHSRSQEVLRGKGALTAGILEPGAFAGPAAPLLLLFALHKMPLLPSPAFLPGLTHLAPIPRSASAPAPAPRLGSGPSLCCPQPSGLTPTLGCSLTSLHGLGDPGALYLCIPRARRGVLRTVGCAVNIDRVRE